MLNLEVSVKRCCVRQMRSCCEKVKGHRGMVVSVCVDVYGRFIIIEHLLLALLNRNVAYPFSVKSIVFPELQYVCPLMKVIKKGKSLCAAER